jgi:oligopeptidase B
MEKTNSDKFLIIGVESKETSEIYLLDLEKLKGGQDHINAVNSKDGGLKCVQKRITGMRYSVEHHGDYLLILTNKDGAKNNKFTRVLISTLYNSIGDGNCETWVDVKPYDDKLHITDAGIIRLLLSLLLLIISHIINLFIVIYIRYRSI